MARNRRQKDSSLSEREGLQDGAETCYQVRFACYQVRFGDSGTKERQKTELEGDVKIFIGSEQDGQD